MKFIKDFFLLNLSQFENFGIDFPIGAIITSFLLALCIAVFIVNYHKRYTTTLLKQLIRHEAYDEARAKTLSELRINASLGIRLALSRKGQLTYMVKRVGEKNQTYEEYIETSKKKGYKDEKINFDEARFHLDSERIDRAKRLVGSTNTEWWRPALMAIFIIAIWVIVALFLPNLLEALNNMAEK